MIQFFGMFLLCMVPFCFSIVRGRNFSMRLKKKSLLSFSLSTLLLSIVCLKLQQAF